MSNKKVNKNEAVEALLAHLCDMIPIDLDDREEQRDNLTEIFQTWLTELGKDYTSEHLTPYINLYYRFDLFLKLCKNISAKDLETLFNKKAEHSLN